MKFNMFKRFAAAGLAAGDPARRPGRGRGGKTGAEARGGGGGETVHRR